MAHRARCGGLSRQTSSARLVLPNRSIAAVPGNRAMLKALERTVLGMLSPAGAKARLSVLIFHRVLPSLDPLFPSEPDAARFTAQMQWLKSSFNVLPLPEAIQRLRSGSLPARAAA